MLIRVTQPDTAYASQGVTITISGEKYNLGPGDSIEIETDERPCTIRAQCGSYDEKVSVLSSAEITIRWEVMKQAMRLEWKKY